jgi:DNA-binding response OmpR family regulator
MISDKKILIISDDVVLHSRLKSNLNDWGYGIDEVAHNEDDISSLIDKINPDLIVVDPDMPTLRGVKICLHIRRISPAPILMLTTEKTEENEIRCLDVHSKDYLSQPFDMAALAIRVENLLTADQTYNN